MPRIPRLDHIKQAARRQHVAAYTVSTAVIVNNLKNPTEVTVISP